MEEQQKQFDHTTKKRLFELEREFKDIGKQRYDLENELRQLEHDLLREGEDNYNNKMAIIKERESEELGNARYQLETQLDEALLKEKDQEIIKFKFEREQI